MSVRFLAIAALLLTASALRAARMMAVDRKRLEAFESDVQRRNQSPTTLH